MYSYGPPHMAGQKQNDQLEYTSSSYVRIRDVALKTCQRRWTIGRSGGRGPGISVPVALHDDIYIYIYIYKVRLITYNKKFKASNVRGSLNKFFVWALLLIVHIQIPFKVISSGYNALDVPFQQLLEGLIEVLLCERVSDLGHSLFHLNSLITTASELME